MLLSILPLKVLLRGPFKEKAIILIIQPQGTYCVFFKAESKNLENFWFKTTLKSHIGPFYLNGIWAQKLLFRNTPPLFINQPLQLSVNADLCFFNSQQLLWYWLMCYCWKNQLWFKSVARVQKQSYGLSKFQVFSPFKFDPIFWIGYCSVMFTIKWWMFIASINKYKMSFLQGQLFLESVTLLLMRNLQITNFDIDLPSGKLLSFNQRMFNHKSIGFIWKFRQFYILGGLLKVAA